MHHSLAHQPMPSAGGISTVEVLPSSQTVLSHVKLMENYSAQVGVPATVPLSSLKPCFRKESMLFLLLVASGFRFTVVLVLLFQLSALSGIQVS